jgi:hypothetical protein
MYELFLWEAEHGAEKPGGKQREDSKHDEGEDSCLTAFDKWLSLVSIVVSIFGERCCKGHYAGKYSEKATNDEYQCFHRTSSPGQLLCS